MKERCDRIQAYWMWWAAFTVARRLNPNVCLYKIGKFADECVIKGTFY